MLDGEKDKEFTLHVSADKHREQEDAPLIQEETPVSPNKEKRGKGKGATSPGKTPRTPMSPGQRALYVVASPARYVQSQITPGGMKSSILSLIICCLGAGTLSVPFVFYKNGVVIGTLLMCFAGYLSYFTGSLIVHCCEKCKASRYEDVAMVTYGKKAKFMTSAFMLACLVGFCISYIILLKDLLPFTINKITDGKAPAVITQKPYAGIIWASIFTFIFVFPLSLPRTLKELRFTGFASAVISIYVVFAIVGVSLNGKVQKDVDTAFKTAFENFNITMFGIFRSLPLIIFAFMYQPNIPMIYSELAKKYPKHMNRIVIIGTIAAIVVYLLAGIFGYVTFIGNPDLDSIMEKQNILEVEAYGNSIPIYVARFLMLLVVLFATPLCLLPCKDSVEEMMWPGKTMTKKQNFIVTLVLCFVSWAFALAIPNFGDALTILGATTNSGIGFLLPVIYYLKVEEKAPRFTPTKIVCYFTFVFICCASVIELGTFIYQKLHPPHQPK